MEMKQMLFTLLVVLVITDAKPAGHHSHQCSDIRGRRCQQDDECVCPNHPAHSKMICNYRRKCHTESIIDRIMRRQPCSDIRGRRCQQDDECVCPNHPAHSKMICNYRRKCHTESIIDRIMRRQPCFRYYKSWCMTDKDCPPCNEARITCEQNECVKMRFITA